MGEGKGAVGLEGDGRVVDQQIQAAVGLFQELGQVFDRLLVVDVQLVELDMDTVLVKTLD